jgi:hypothetical protein
VWREREKEKEKERERERERERELTLCVLLPKTNAQREIVVDNTLQAPALTSAKCPVFAIGSVSALLRKKTYTHTQVYTQRDVCTPRARAHTHTHTHTHVHTYTHTHRGRCKMLASKAGALVESRGMYKC